MEKEKGAQVEGFTLSGDEVAQLTDKGFKIYDLPFYQEMSDLDNADKKKRKLVIPVELVNGTQTEWIANKTSQRVIIAQRGRILSEWVGFTGKFVIKNQVVGKDEKQVIYLS